MLTGINSEHSGRQDAVLFDRKQGLVEVALGPRNSRFATAGYEELAARERQMSDAEYTRLMYVATTRARDHLVLSLRRPAQRGPKSPAGVMTAHLEAAPALWEPVEPASLSDTPEQDTVAEDRQDGAGETPVAHTLAAREEWVERREQLLDDLGRPGFVAATALGSREWDDKDEAESPEPWRRGRGGTSVGRAVHAVLQSIDLATGADIDDRAQAQAAAEGIPSSARHIARLSRAAVDSDIVKRAVASGRFWREVPVAVAIGGGSLHGFIDLLFEEAGGLVVVDYKTDAVSAHRDRQCRLVLSLARGCLRPRHQGSHGAGGQRGRIPLPATTSRGTVGRLGAGNAGCVGRGRGTARHGDEVALRDGGEARSGSRSTEQHLPPRAKARLRIRLHDQLRHDHFPVLAVQAVVVLRLRTLAVPGGDSPDCGKRATHVGRGLKATGKPSNNHPGAIQHLPPPKINPSRSLVLGQRKSAIWPEEETRRSRWSTSYARRRWP